LYRPRSREELDPHSGDGGITLRQGWVQLDILRMLGGGMVRSVRGLTVVADPKRPVDGAYAALIEFENGTPATAVFDGYGYFDGAELTFGLGLFGRPRTRKTNLEAHRLVSSFATPQDEFAFKYETRVGGSKARGDLDPPLEKHQFFGLTIVSCERGALRQTPDGIMIHEADDWREITSKPRLYAEIELDIMYDAWANDKPVRSHDGAWGKATTELCLAILESARERRELVLRHQVPF
jgi:phthalate 4,5-cis-dihydrodiol dehydrogenase